MRELSENTRCILFMVFAMAGFAVEDAVIKRLSADLPISQVLMMIGGGGVLVFSIASVLRRNNPFARPVLNPWFALRTLCELLSGILFVCAIVYASLSASSAILQATPLAVALGAAVFLRQSVSVQQWVMIALGFLGVLLIIQPGTAAFAPATLFAVAGVMFLATRDVVTRFLAVSVSPLTVSFWAFFALFSAGLITVPMFSPFQPVTALHGQLLVLSTATGAAAYLCVVLATRGGDVAVIAPFRYTRLLFALGLGVWVFHEPLTWPMVIGSALIIISGVMSVRSSRRQSRLTTV